VRDDTSNQTGWGPLSDNGDRPILSNARPCRALAAPGGPLRASSAIAKNAGDLARNYLILSVSTRVAPRGPSSRRTMAQWKAVVPVRRLWLVVLGSL
jgi:hypothetical protein